MFESIIWISVFFLSGLILNINMEFEIFEQIINIGILSFSILLFILSIIAFRKTGLKKIIYASIAFILFTIQLTYEILGDMINQFETPYNDLIISSITLFILVLFFFAVFRKN